jgi:hypothetical protein
MKCMFDEKCYVWLTSSIFMKMPEWSMLFSNLVTPFIEDLLKNKRIYAYQIALNHNGGDNIRVCLLTKKSQAIRLAMDLSLASKDFFCRFDKKETPAEVNANGIFMQFPSNCIKHGLFRLDFSLGDFGAYNIDQKISELLLAKFCEEDISEVSILIFALFLHISFITRLVTKSNVDTNFIRHIHQEILCEQQFTISSGHALEEIGIQIKEEVEQASRKTGLITEDTPWLNSWITFCSKKIESEIKDFKSRDEISIYYRKNFFLINDLLGFQIMDIMLLSNLFITLFK